MSFANHTQTTKLENTVTESLTTAMSSAVTETTVVMAKTDEFPTTVISSTIMENFTRTDVQNKIGTFAEITPTSEMTPSTEIMTSQIGESTPVTIDIEQSIVENLLKLIRQ